MMPELPKELIEEILYRVPATYLKRFQLTCKWWYRLIKYDKRFAKQHSEKAPKQLLFLLLTKTKNSRISSISPISLNGVTIIPSSKAKLTDHLGISRVFHFEGLLLCIPEDESRILVWNPLTAQTRWINNGHNRSTLLHKYVLVYSQVSKNYKILNFDYGSRDSNIYEFESDSWRVLVHDDDVSPEWFMYYYSENCVSLKGKTYWFVKYAKTYPISLLGFDFSVEKSERVSLPYQRHYYACANLSVVREERLSVLLQRQHHNKFEVWVTDKIADETTKVVSWSKVLALDSRPDLDTSFCFVLDVEKKVLVWCVKCIYLKKYLFKTEKTYRYMIYIVGEDNKVTPVGITMDYSDVHGQCWPAILSYVPSLVQFEQAPVVIFGSRRKRKWGTST